MVTFRDVHNLLLFNAGGFVNSWIHYCCCKSKYFLYSWVIIGRTCLKCGNCLTWQGKRLKALSRIIMNALNFNWKVKKSCEYLQICKPWKHIGLLDFFCKFAVESILRLLFENMKWNFVFWKICSTMKYARNKTVHSPPPALSKGDGGWPLITASVAPFTRAAPRPPTTFEVRTLQPYLLKLFTAVDCWICERSRWIQADRVIDVVDSKESLRK